MTVRVTDNGATKLLADLKALGAMKVRVGVLADEPKRDREGRGGRASLLEVAAMHEFGAPGANIPQRSFIRGTVDAKAAEIAAKQTALAKQVAEGELDPRVALERLGASVAGMVQTRIAEGIDPPNAPATVAAKGSSTPLIDTGQLRSSITWQVG